MNQTVREWLRNEQRLGVRHCAIPTGPPATPARADASPGASEPVDAAPVPPAKQRLGAATPSMFDDDPDLPTMCREELSEEAAQAALATLDSEQVKGCKRCRLCEHRTQTVFGVGNPRPQLVFVGEGPGADEDAQGIPFVGRAGQLLTRMIAAMTLTREQVYICNIVKCRPPGNRTPAEDEMQTCSPFLYRQLAILRPRVIVALGRPASQTLLATKVAISRLRGKFHDFPVPAMANLGLPSARLMPTFHPAYLLRNPAAKGDAWDDLQQVMRFLGLKTPS